jgi:hypothetical protein
LPDNFQESGLWGDEEGGEEEEEAADGDLACMNSDADDTSDELGVTEEGTEDGQICL